MRQGSFLLAGSSFPMEKRFFLLTGSSFLAGKSSFLSTGSSFPAKKSSFLSAGSSFPRKKSSFLFSFRRTLFAVPRSLAVRGRGDVSRRFMGRRIPRLRCRARKLEFPHSGRVHAARGSDSSSREDSRASSHSSTGRRGKRRPLVQLTTVNKVTCVSPCPTGSGFSLRWC